ncbi:hypothetical protein [Labrenzia sp. PHM005]|uniref:hypothetical protein n=1 Tax=Labrenzia sp. PHM005 TaxID=2590016 RepID=UPI00143D204F|nr:hypothetical protein [Labrenzia sp. PHM005]
MAFLFDQPEFIKLIRCPDHSGAADLQKFNEPPNARVTLTGAFVEMIDDNYAWY